MFKLLPPKEVQKVEREYLLRRLSIIFATLSALTVFTSVALLPSLIFARERREAALFTLDSISRVPDSVNKEALEKWVEKVTSQLGALNPDPLLDQPYEFFLQITKSKPVGVTVTSLSWSRQGNNRNLKVGGFAKSRQALLTFQSKLLASGDWSQVDLPLSTITRETDIPFDISLTPPKAK